MTIESYLERIALAVEKLVGSQKVLAISEAATAAAVNPTQRAATPLSETKPSAMNGAANGAVAAVPDLPTRPKKLTVVTGDPTPAPQSATFVDMRNALVDVKTKFGPDVSRAIMMKVGAVSATEIKPQDFSSVIALCAQQMEVKAG